MPHPLQYFVSLNNSDSTIGIYEFPGTEKEKYFSLKPGEEAIIKIKEKKVKDVEIKETKTFDKKDRHPINTINSNK